MKTCVKRALVALGIALVLPLIFGACNKKPSLHSCKNSEDCRVERGGPGGVCVMGKCQECAENIDCADLKQCVNNRCVFVCQTDGDCADGHHCENNACTADCLNDSNCLGDKVCARGRCVSQGLANDPNALGDANGQCNATERIQFAFDSFAIGASYHKYMDQIAECLRNNPGLILTVEGHTDDRGTPTYNMALGERRALAVKNYLQLQKGIEPYRIKTVSYGEQKPLDNERTEHAWQQNRRTEFLVENSR